MMDAGRSTFNSVAHGMWTAFRWLGNRTVQRGTLEQRLQRLEDEQAVRDLLVQYGFCYDSSDLDGLMALFAEDAVLVNSRGTFVGSKAIEENYRWINAQRQASFHFITNAQVRVGDGGREAWATAYFQSWAMDLSGDRRALLGSYVLRLVKAGDRWQIGDCRLTANLSTGQAPGPPASLMAPGAPRPTLPETSDDWIRP